MTHPAPLRTLRQLLWLSCLTSVFALPATSAHAQAVCNSDGQPAPTELLERFINASCANCWQDASAPPASPGIIALDWIVPAASGDDAPLAGAASRDAAARLQALSQPAPDRMSHQRTLLQPGAGATLRLAHGPAVGDYVGITLEWRLPQATAVSLPLQAWVVLTEALPMGTEQSPLPRNLARNTFQPLWEKSDMLSTSEYLVIKDLRAMALPEGTQPARVRLTGWVQDAGGRLLAAAQTGCSEGEGQ